MKIKNPLTKYNKFPKTHLVTYPSNSSLLDTMTYFPFYSIFNSFDTGIEDPNQPENSDLYFQLILNYIPIQAKTGTNKVINDNELILYIERSNFFQEAPLLCNIQKDELICLIWDTRTIDLLTLNIVLNNNTIDRKSNTLEGNYVPYVILQPCIRLGVTTLSSSFYCQRKSILSILTSSFSSNKNTIIGTHLHELIQTSLTLKTLTINDLKEKSKELIFRDCLEISKAGQSINFINEKVSFYFPYIISFHENLIVRNKFINGKNKIEIFNVEEPVNSVLFGLSGFIDIIIRIENKLYIIELKTIFNKKPLCISSVNSSYISQVTLYIALLNEKYNLTLSSAYIYNILNPTYDFLEVKHDKNVLKNILNARNQLVYHLNPINPIPKAISDSEERKRKCTDPVYNKKSAVLNYADSDNYVDIEEFENIFYWNENHLNFINTEFKYYKAEIYKVLKSNNYIVTEEIKTIKICKFHIKNKELSVFINKEYNEIIECYKGSKFLCINEINSKNKNNIKFMLIKRLEMTTIKNENSEKIYVLKKQIEDIYEEQYIQRILQGCNIKTYFVIEEKFKGQFGAKINSILDLFIKGNLENDKFSSLLISTLNL